jgi:hypothetical protein
MKKLQIGLVLLLASLFTVAHAADSCPGVYLTNATGSPPVVTGTSVSYVAWGPSPSYYAYVDGGAIYLQDPNPFDPPGTFFATSISTGLAYGNHALWVQWDACTVNFSNVAPTQRVDYVNVTSGSAGAAWGYWAGHFGSASPTTTSNGLTYNSIADNYNGWGWGATYGASFAVCGFGGDPGSGWLTSIAVGSTTKLSSAASYSYASGCASWAWSNGNIGLPYSGGPTQVTVTHY